MNKKIVLIIGMIVVVAFGLLVISLQIPSQKGYWKLNKAAEERAIIYLKDWDIGIENTEGSNGLSSFRAIEMENKNVAEIGNGITQEEAEEIAKNAMLKYSKQFGIRYDGELEILDTWSNSDEWRIFFKPQKHNGYEICIPGFFYYGSCFKKSGAVTLYSDGQINEMTIHMFGDISLPDTPALSNEELEKVSGFSGCTDDLYIYPDYDSQTGIWSYNLMRVCSDNIIDATNGDLLFKIVPTWE